MFQRSCLVSLNFNLLMKIDQLFQYLYILFSLMVLVYHLFFPNNAALADIYSGSFRYIAKLNTVEAK